MCHKRNANQDFILYLFCCQTYKRNVKFLSHRSLMDSSLVERDYVYNYHGNDLIKVGSGYFTDVKCQLSLVWVTGTCNPSTWEAGAGGSSWIEGLQGPQREALFQRTRRRRKERRKSAQVGESRAPEVSSSSLALLGMENPFLSYNVLF